MARLEQVRRLMLAEPSMIERALWSALAAVLAGLARAALGRIADEAPFITFLPFAMLVVVLLGWRWALFYVACSTVVIAVFFRTGNLVRNGVHLDSVLLLLVFAISTALLIAIGDGLRGVIRALSAAHRDIEDLNRELFHRGQNTLTVVEALVRLSSRTEGLTLADYRDGLVDRLHALARANKLFAAPEHRAELGALVEQAVAPFAPKDGVAIAGPPCTPRSEARQSMALVLHELATNALKHGALSCPGGRVEVAWTLDDRGAADFRWHEIGGPPVAPPARKGMGSSLLASMRQLKPELDWDPAGLRCRLHVPIESDPA